MQKVNTMSLFTLYGNNKLKLKIAAFFFVSLFLSLFITRIAIYLITPNYFSGLTFVNFMFGFLNGIRFDLAVIGLFFMPLQLFLFLPFDGRNYIKTFAIINSLFFSVFVVLLCSDAVFFQIFQKHLETEIVTALSNTDFIADLVIKKYWFLLLLAFSAFALFVRFLLRYTDKNYIASNANLKYCMQSIIIMFCTAVTGFCFAWGRLSLHGHLLKVMDSNIFANKQVSAMSLNGPFCLYEAMSKYKNITPITDLKQSVLSTSKQIITENEIVPNPDYLFMRKRIKHSVKLNNPNFVFIFLESWNKEQIEKYPKTAKNLNKLKNNGIWFSNFYVAGRRSLLGITATLFSVPHVYGLPYLNKGLESKNFPRFANYFKNKGYKTMLIQTDRTRSEKMEEVAAYHGFDNFYSRADFAKGKGSIRTLVKGYEKEGFDFLFDTINKTAVGNNGDGENKFMTFFYTSVPHTQYLTEVPEKNRLYEGKTEEERYLNILSYVDDSLGDFFKKAKKTKWYDNTVFVFLPDHKATLKGQKFVNNDETKNLFSSFMLIYSPRYFKHSVNDVISGQEDFLPTVLDMLGTEESYASAGKSLFEVKKREAKYIYGENNRTYIVSLNGNKEVDNNGVSAANVNSLTAEEKKALAFNEALYGIIQKDKWMGTAN